MEKVQLPSSDNSEKGSVSGMLATGGARRATPVASTPRGGDSTVSSPPDPEVPEKNTRRKYTTKFKLQILAKADACTQPGQLGALLRSEGLYSSNVTAWRRQREQGIINAMAPKKRGRKPSEKNPLTSKVAQLEKENRRLQQKLTRAELIIDAQKKMSEILGITQNLNDSEEIK